MKALLNLFIVLCALHGANSLAAGSGLNRDNIRDYIIDDTSHATTKTVSAAEVDSRVAAATLGKHTLYIPACSMVSNLTDGPSIGYGETTTNKLQRCTYDFDASTQEAAQFQIAMPKKWNKGTVSAQFYWSHAATTTNFGVVWGVQCGAYSDDDAYDAALGTAQTMTDTGGTTDDTYVTSETSAVTIAGTPANDDLIVCQVYRKAADASDTLAVDARLRGVKFYYTTDAQTDD